MASNPEEILKLEDEKSQLGNPKKSEVRLDFMELHLMIHFLIKQKFEKNVNLKY
jgi:hypothetical protein